MLQGHRSSFIFMFSGQCSLVHSNITQDTYFRLTLQLKSNKAVLCTTRFIFWVMFELYWVLYWKAVISMLILASPSNDYFKRPMQGVKLDSSSGWWLCGRTQSQGSSSQLFFLSSLAFACGFVKFVHLTHLLRSEGIITLVASEAGDTAKNDVNCLSSYQQEMQAWKGAKPQGSNFCASLYLSF